MPRIVYTSDLHGVIDLYRAAGDAAVRTRADALIFGGDLCPGTPSGASQRLPIEQPEFVLYRLSHLFDMWKDAHPDLRIFAIPGNDDCQTILPALEDLETNNLIENLHKVTRTLGDYTLMGLSYVPPTPFHLKDFERWDDAPDRESDSNNYRCIIGTPRGFKVIEDFETYLNSLPSIKQELERFTVKDPAHTVAVIHTPPFNTACDVLFDGRHIGSKAVRSWIEKTQPRLTLHGHIHESPKLSGTFLDRIGSTTVINPGCDHTRPHLVFIDLDNPTEIDHSLYGEKTAL
ncbi:MAG: metallophosphoesterase family protein [Terriglobia bacterium]